MRVSRLDEMTGGWFVGDFDPVALRSPHAEVAYKTYAAGALEPEHWQVAATEVTLVISGQARLGGRLVSAGDIVVLEPGRDDASGFEAVTDVTLVAVKLPSLPHDKRLV